MKPIKTSIFLLFLLFSFLASGKAQTNEDCETCHSSPELTAERRGRTLSLYIDFKRYSASAHKGLACIDCHQDADVEDFPHPKTLKAVTCGSCHDEAAEQFKTGVHSLATIEEESLTMSCKDCHGTHDITSPQDLSSRVYATKVAEICSRCHDDEVLARQYGFLTSRLKTYARSIHGKASIFGETRVANCASCHGYHDILPSTDPKSSIHPDNLPGTCGRCHPGAGKNYAKGKIHVISEKETNKWAYYVKIVYIILIAWIVIVFLIFIVSDLFHRLIHKKKTVSA